MTALVIAIFIGIVIYSLILDKVDDYNKSVEESINNTRNERITKKYDRIKHSNGSFERYVNVDYGERIVGDKTIITQSYLGRDITGIIKPMTRVRTINRNVSDTTESRDRCRNDGKRKHIQEQKLNYEYPSRSGYRSFAYGEA